MRRKNKKRFTIDEKFLFGVSVGMVLFLGIYFIMQEGSEETQDIEKEPKELKEIMERCNKTSLITSAKCVNSITRKFYNYNMSNKQTDFLQDLSFERIKDEGGVCRQWTDYYCYIGKRLGFKTTKPIMDSYLDGEEDRRRHTFCIWSSSEGYCSIDGETITCANFDNSEFNKTNERGSENGRRKNS